MAETLSKSRPDTRCRFSYYNGIGIGINVFESRSDLVYARTVINGTRILRKILQKSLLFKLIGIASRREIARYGLKGNKILGKYERSSSSVTGSSPFSE